MGVHKKYFELVEKQEELLKRKNVIDESFYNLRSVLFLGNLSLFYFLKYSNEIIMVESGIYS